ncbi:hypothetical protein MJO28_013043, partial [Puccinia striiformis f. sp. tritici]
SIFSLTILIDWWTQTQSNGQSTSWTKLSQNYKGLPICDPFSEPGTIDFNTTNYNDANWIPFKSSSPTSSTTIKSSTCATPSPDYLSALRLISHVPISTPLSQCGKLIHHPSSSSSSTNQTKSHQEGFNRNKVDNWGRPYPDLTNYSNSSTPDNLRSFARLNCKLINGFFYGLVSYMTNSLCLNSSSDSIPKERSRRLIIIDDIDEFSVQSDWHPPRLAKSRVRELYGPTMKKWEKRTVPSGLWDLAFFGRRNRQRNESTSNPLGHEELVVANMILILNQDYQIYMARYTLMDMIGKQFWTAHDWQAGLKHGLGKRFVNFFPDHRVHQIRQLQIFVANQEGLPIFDFLNI